MRPEARPTPRGSSPGHPTEADLRVRRPDAHEEARPTEQRALEDSQPDARVEERDGELGGE